MEELIERTSKLTIGDGLEDGIDVSPLSSESQQRTVSDYITVGRDEGGDRGLRRTHAFRRHLR